MQTFLPYPGFVRSAGVLDDKRLGKQRVETFQILRALIWPSYGWKRHPAVTMWRGFTPALVSYGIAMCREWSARGHADALEDQLLEYGPAHTFDELSAEGLLPSWLGNDAVHQSHRHALANKAPQLYPSNWAGEAGYVWPTPVYPVWPLPFTSDSDTPTRIVSILEDNGLNAPAWDALTTLRNGGHVHLDADISVAASRLLPGLTAVFLDADIPTDEPLPPRVSAGGGTISASIARQPSDTDRAAMDDEKSGVARIRFFRRDQAVPDPDRFSLVVTWSAAVPDDLADLPRVTVEV